MTTSDGTRVTKIGYSVPVSCCMAADYGLGPKCNHPPPPPIPLRRRVKYRIASWWDRRPRVHLGPCDHEDCWD